MVAPFPSPSRSGTPPALARFGAQPVGPWLSLGKTILDSVGQVAGAHQKRVEQAGFALLKAPDIPSILVESGFISNAEDCRQLCDPRHQTRVAQAIFEGVVQHFKTNRLV